MSLSKQALQDLLIQDLAAALKALQEALPEQSDKYGVVLALQARLKALNKERMLGGLSMDEYARYLNGIRADAIHLLDSVAPADFQMPAAAAGGVPGGKPAPKQGSVLYRVPQQMPLQKPTICTVRVAIEEDALFEDIELDENTRLRRRVQVSDMMQAELLDPEGGVFAIRPLSAPEQLVSEIGYTQWLFSATPRVEGIHQLLIKVSMMEYVPNLGRYVPKEVSILETVTIVTEQPAPPDEAPQPFKATGESFALGPTSLQSTNQPSTNQPPTNQQINPKQINNPTKSLALFLAFLVVAPGATWALAPAPVRDFWEAEWKGTPDAYADYVATYKDNLAPAAKTRVEKARYYKAELTMDLGDLREYQTLHIAGEYKEEVVGKIATLELRAVEKLEKQPESARFEQYIRDFPDGQRWQAVKQIAEAQPEARRAEALQTLEKTAVQTLQTQPTPALARNLLTTYPQTAAQPAVRQALAARPDVKTAVRPQFEAALTQSLAQNPDVPTARAVLEEFPKRHAQVEQAVAARPAVQKAVAADIQRAKTKAATTPTTSQPAQTLAPTPDSDGDGTPDASDGCPQDKTKTAPGTCGCGTADTDTDGDGTPDCKDGCPQDKTKTAPGTCGCGTPDGDTDGDEIPDCQDDCPREKGSAARKGCPEPKPDPKETPEKHNRRSGLEMVPVPGGTFMMGSPDSDKDAEDDEKPQHKVTLSTFQIGKYEVTQADWKDIMGKNPSNFKCDQCPVERVSWDDIQTFLKKLNQRYPSKNYRLPTEAEWEYAARGGAGAKQTKYAGSDDVNKVAWYDGNSGYKTHPVGEKAPNALGLYDMSGNVYEWCQDDWHDNYRNAPSDGKAWVDSGGRGSYRVIRGGGWTAVPGTAVPRNRFFYDPQNRNGNLGFRLVRSAL